MYMRLQEGIKIGCQAYTTKGGLGKDSFLRVAKEQKPRRIKHSVSIYWRTKGSEWNGLMGKPEWALFALYNRLYFEVFQLKMTALQSLRKIKTILTIGIAST